MANRSGTTAGMATASRFLWLVVLVPVLAISGYSLFYVARHLGVPPIFAIGMSTCFDGAAILCADYSLKYAQEGMAGSAPRIAVRAFALVGAFVQTFHARLGHELAWAWVLWASLPVISVTVYEVHLRWERRKALARAGVLFPAPLPSFGTVSWLLFPGRTLTSMRDIVGERTNAVLTAAKQRPMLPGVSKPIPVTTESDTQDKPAITSANPADASDAVIRSWGREQGYRVGDRGPLPAGLAEAYRAAHNGGAHV